MANEIEYRIRALAMEEVGANDWGWFYLSWADEKEWKGAAYVMGYGPVTARLRCNAFGINPGGQCLVSKLPDDVPPPPEGYSNRLLNLEELRTIDPNVKTLGELRKEHP